MNINTAKYLLGVVDLSNSRGDQLLVFECEGIPQSNLPMTPKVIRLKNTDSVQGLPYQLWEDMVGLFQVASVVHWHQLIIQLKNC